MNADWRNWSEAQFRGVIVSDCTRLGLTVNYHKIDRASSVKGWPDLEIVGPGGIMHRELKRMNGTLSPNQRRISVILKQAGANWMVWRPVDWYEGTIERQLIRISKATC